MEDCKYPHKKQYKFFSDAFMDAHWINRHPECNSPYAGAYECGDHFHVGRLRRPEDRASQAQLNQRVEWLRKEIGHTLDFEQVAQALFELYRQGGRAGRRIMSFWQKIPPGRFKPRRKHRRRQDRWNSHLPHPEKFNIKAQGTG